MKMEEKILFNVDLIWSETIKPSSPTPSHLKTFTLSLIDQIVPAFHIPILMFYPSKQNNQTIDISTLKTSLAHTLTKLYPLAGRCIDDSRVSCNDEGIPFFETQINCNLSYILESPHKLQVLTDFLPPRELLALGPRPISELVPLAFQINVFNCGGVVIGYYMLHKLLDAASLGTFFRYWAALASNLNKDAVAPDYDAIVKAFPPSPTIEQAVVPDLCKGTQTNSPPIVVVVKSFRITNDAISKLKSKAVSEIVPNPTSFETVSGFVWECTIDAACTARTATHENVPETTVLSISANMRSRTNPPLPRESMGNCATHILAVKFTNQGTFPETVGEIHEVIAKAKKDVERYQGENGVEEICKDREAASRFVMEDSSCVYHLNSWCKLGLSEADFGFGKPKWIIPTDGNIPPSLRNSIFFTDYSDSSGDGIEIWLFLEENEMKLLESNPKFLDLASPN